MRTPKINEFCEVNYDGRTCVARIIKINPDETFNTSTSFGAKIFNIPFSKYKHSYDLGNLIINMLEEKFSLGLKTIDAIMANKEINLLLEERAWMIQKPQDETPVP